MQPIKMLNLAFISLALVAVMFVAAGAKHATDAQIVDSVEGSFVYRRDLKDDAITVRSKEGVVTLTGTVSEEHHKALAYDTAAAQDGVKRVDDRLVVRSDGPAPKSDAWLASKVKTTLLFHRSVSAVDTEIDVKDGHVTLRGVADDQAQKDLTGEYAADVEGVREVHNELTVAKGSGKARKLDERIDDSSITAQVKLALFFHRSTSALRTHVQTRAGVVTLTGSAKSRAEKDLADKIVSDITGVRKVKNHISIDKS